MKIYCYIFKVKEWQYDLHFMQTLFSISAPRDFFNVYTHLLTDQSTHNVKRPFDSFLFGRIYIEWKN